jgi:hypothetical protein
LRFDAEGELKSKFYVEREEYERLLSFKEHADKVAVKEAALNEELQGLHFDQRELKASLDGLRRQLEVAKSDKIELTAKLELA